MTAWNALKTASDAGRAQGNVAWACIWIPNFTKSFYVQFFPGEIPLPEFSVGSAFQGAVSNTIAKYVGLDTAVEPTTTGA